MHFDMTVPLMYFSKHGFCYVGLFKRAMILSTSLRLLWCSVQCAQLDSNLIKPEVTQ